MPFNAKKQKQLEDKYLNKRAIIEKNGLSIYVVISRVSQMYGHVRFLVKPDAGAGMIWVTNIEILKESDEQ